MNTHIDFTILKPGATNDQVEALCKTAIEKEYAAVCVPPHYVSMVKTILSNQTYKPQICTVIGFPHGMQSWNVKETESLECIQHGATELDIVSNTSMVKNGDWKAWHEEISAFTSVCKQHGVISKLIIETSLLSVEEIDKICELVQDTDLDFVKTSTGFVGDGAKLEIVRRMRKLLPSRFRIKASGGIRDIEKARAFIDAGADRIGTSTAL